MKKRHQGCACTEKRPHEDKMRHPSASQGEGPGEKPTLPTPWSWTSSLQNWEEMKFCLSPPGFGGLFQQPSQTNVPFSQDVEHRAGKPVVHRTNQTFITWEEIQGDVTHSVVVWIGSVNKAAHLKHWYDWNQPTNQVYIQCGVCVSAL